MLKDDIWKIIHHRFVRDAAILQLSSLLSTAISVAASVILARALLPERYGQYTLVFALGGIIVSFLDMGEGSAAMTFLPKIDKSKDAEAARQLLGYTVKSTLFFTGLGSLVGALVAVWLGHHFYSSIRIGYYAAVIILSAGLTVLSDPALSLLQSAKRPHHKAKKSKPSQPKFASQPSRKIRARILSM